MAFGKDEDSVPTGGPNIRQQMRLGTRRAPSGGGGGGGGGGLYRDQYHPPDDGSTDLVRILPGAFPTPQVDFENKDFYYTEAGQPVMVNLPFFRYIDYYYHPRKRQIIGSEGPLGGFKGKGTPCLAADWYWYEWRTRKDSNSDKPNTIRRSDKCAVSVLVQAPFYKVPQTNKEGAVQMNDRTKTPYMEWKKGSLRGNDALAMGGYEKKFGHVMHWSLGYGHWESLRQYANTLASNCRTCGGNGTIRECALVCQSCGEAVVEMDTTTLTTGELEKIKDDQVRCRYCKHFGYLDNIIECAQCSNGKEASMFDHDLEVRQVKSSEKGKGTTLMVVRAIGPRPILDQFGAEQRKPLDLAKIFTPFSMEAQMKILGPVPDEQSQVVRTPVTGSGHDNQQG